MASRTDEKQASTAERLLGAGLVGSRDVGSQLGLSIIAVEQIGQIYGQQIEWFIEDQRSTFQKLGQTMNPLSAWADHFERRSRHISEGIRQFVDTVQEITERSAVQRQGLWSPFATAAGLPKAQIVRALPRKRVMERLHTDHKRLGRVLGIMEKLVRKLDTLSPREKSLLISGIEYISEYPDAIHHPLEDKLFRSLLEADLSEEEQNDVKNNALAHEQLTAATRKMLENVDAIRSGPTERAAALVADLSEYIEQQRRHMAFEEQRVFRLADKKLSAAVLRELDDEDERSRDPLFEQRRDRFDNLYYYVSDQL